MSDNSSTSSEQAAEKSSWIRVNPPVFIGAASLCLIFVIFAVVSPKTAEALFGGIQSWVVQTAGWFYILAVALFLLFVIILAMSDYGCIKLGPDHSEPDYPYSSWFAMLFSGW